MFKYASHALNNSFFLNGLVGCSSSPVAYPTLSEIIRLATPIRGHRRKARRCELLWDRRSETVWWLRFIALPVLSRRQWYGRLGICLVRYGRQPESRFRTHVCIGYSAHPFRRWDGRADHCSRAWGAAGPTTARESREFDSGPVPGRKQRVLTVLWCLAHPPAARPLRSGTDVPYFWVVP